MLHAPRKQSRSNNGLVCDRYGDISPGLGRDHSCFGTQAYELARFLLPFSFLFINTRKSNMPTSSSVLQCLCLIKMSTLMRLVRCTANIFSEALKPTSVARKHTHDLNYLTR